MSLTFIIKVKLYNFTGFFFSCLKSAEHGCIIVLEYLANWQRTLVIELQPDRHCPLPLFLRANFPKWLDLEPKWLDLEPWILQSCSVVHIWRDFSIFALNNLTVEILLHKISRPSCYFIIGIILDVQHNKSSLLSFLNLLQIVRHYRLYVIVAYSCLQVVRQWQQRRTGCNGAETHCTPDDSGHTLPRLGRFGVAAGKFCSFSSS